MDYAEREALAAAWHGWLARYPWQVFFTIAYKDSVPARLAIDRAARWLHGLFSLYSDRVDRLFAFIAAEQFARGGYHAHGLFFTEPVSYLDISDSLHMAWLYGRELFECMVRAESIRSQDAVRGYVSKYVVKSVGNREVDYDLIEFKLDKPAGLL